MSLILLLRSGATGSGTAVLTGLGSLTANGSFAASGGPPTPVVPQLIVEIDVTNNPTSPTRTWTNITPHIRGQITWKRSGRDWELQRTSTGTLSMLCDDRSGVMTNLALKKAQWVRVRAVWNGVTYPRWQGIIENISRQWPGTGFDQTVQIDCSDTLKLPNLFDLYGQTFPAQYSGDRVAQICSLVGVSTSGIDQGSDVLDAITTAYSQGSFALSSLLDIEDSESGLLVANPNGTITFQGRHWRILNSNTPAGTFGETTGQIPYTQTASETDDDAKIANAVTVTLNNASTPAVTVTDSTSQGQYFQRWLNKTLLHSNAYVATDAAQYFLQHYKDPPPRIPRIDVPLAAVSSSLMPTVLGANNSSRFTFIRNSSPSINMDVFVEQISETVSPSLNDWTVSFLLSPASQEVAWVLEDSVRGVLDSTTILTY